MEPNILFSKCITLLYRETQIENLTENSADLVKTTIDKVRVSDTVIGIPTKRDTAQGLKNLVIEMCRNGHKHSYDPLELLQQIRIITNGDDNLYQAIAQGIEPELSPPVLKRTVTNIKKTIANQFREYKAAEIVKRAHKDLSFNRHNISDLSEYIRNIILELEVTSTKAVAKDPAIVNSMNFSDDDSVRNVYNSVAESNSEGLVFTTGFRELNEALQGGPRAGDTVVVAALQHDYKSGLTAGEFAHICMLNKPKCKDSNKKPLALRISFEDPIRNTAQFIYQLLRYEETGEKVDITQVSIEEMSKYVQKKMTSTGYHVIMEEVNPMNWTYQSLINRIIELESEGYCVEVLCVDYLYKLPTTGCTQGSTGDDVLDMFSRVRAYCAASGILFITPHQLSTDAKRLLQSTPSEQFLHVIKGGGFFEKTKGLDRIYDIGILIHRVETPAGTFLHVVVDKHRFPTVIDAHKKSFFLHMPDCGMPIPCNLFDSDYRVLRKIPRSKATADDALFKL